MKGKRAPHKSQKQSNKFHIDDEIKELQSQYDSLGDVLPETIKRFADFPLSKRTQRGLADAKYVHPTAIQRDSLIPALQGKDVLGAAVTGSGKTLAFLIPVLEHLFIKKWSRLDGVGAIIISPTRELAYQIFETLKKIGKHHDFSAGLIIGGKNLKFERKRMDGINILICTPGRLLQHMDENPLFNASTMEMLVLDEADRCLDMGFEQTLNAIIENFPPERQTLLFSATQTSSVKDLARLNLNEPVFVGCKLNEKQGTVAAVPDLLQQNYVVLPLEEKITMLWSFIKNHLKQKIIVFLSSCKQVKYVYEIFCKLRPGTSLLALYGTLHQDRRIAIYNDFVKKSNVVLFATDIASRGLDFPAVNWVVQLDCPEDVTQYIHRAGRSARNKARGESLLVLLPSEEEGMIKELAKKDIIVRKIQIDPKKLFSPRAKIEGFLAQLPELKATAQRAFVSYIKSVFLMKNKQIFNVTKLDFEAYARSLGLVVTPRVRFLERFMKGKTAGQSKVTQRESDEHKLDFKTLESESESDDDFIKVKRRDHDIQNPTVVADEDEEDLSTLPAIPKREKIVTKTALAKKAIKKKLLINEKRRFDDDGNEILDVREQMAAELLSKQGENAPNGIDIETAKQLLSKVDQIDKQRFRELVKQRHRKLKEKLKQRTDEDKHEKEAGEDEEDSEQNDSDDSDENSVDLSWLPDPDKVYNKSAQAEDASDSEEDEDTDGGSATAEEVDDEDADNDYIEPPSKRSKITAKLSLNDAESIAAQLLATSKY